MATPTLKSFVALQEILRGDICRVDGCTKFQVVLAEMAPVKAGAIAPAYGM